jgi:hypothetical protein
VTTTYDLLIDHLTNQVNALSRRSQAAFFWACAQALLPEYQRWATLRGKSEALLDQTLSIAEAFALTGVLPGRPQLEQLLVDLEEACPPGESPDEFSHTNAQDCLICADTCIRPFVDETWSPGPVIWYALQPILEETTEQCFGVSDVGSGPHEEAQMQVIQSQPAMVAAIEFCRWAIRFLEERPEPDADALGLLRMRAQVLEP